MKRIYKPVNKWEEVNYNMWGSVKDRKLFLSKAIKLTSDHYKYGEFMSRVVREWPVSCINSLTDLSINRKAWLGHAACALALRCPEDITRKAWSYLTYEQQLLANAQAAKWIRWWEKYYRKGCKIPEIVEKEVLPLWDSR